MPSGVMEAVLPVEAPDSLHQKELRESAEMKRNLATAAEDDNDDLVQAADGDDEGVEVILGNDKGSATKQEGTRSSDVFRSQPPQQHPTRPRAMRAPKSGPPHQPYGSGSWGYGPPSSMQHHHPHHHGEYAPPPPPRPYTVPHYAPSGSFDDQSLYRHHTAYYSPHAHYPPRYSDEVNVISPNHGPNLTPRPRSMHASPQSHHYRYPPSSPIRRPGGAAPGGPPRIRNYAIRRGQEGGSAMNRSPYPAPEEWNTRPPAVTKSASGDMSRHRHQQQQPPMVADSSFESGPDAASRSHPATPGSSIMPPPEAHYPFYGAATASWGSFDTGGSLPAPPPHFDGYSYGPPPESPYSPYMHHQHHQHHPQAPPQPYIYHSESFPPPAHYGPNGSFSYSYDTDDRMHHSYYEHHTSANKVTPTSKSRKGKSEKGGASAARDLLPKAAEEVDFDVVSPPLEPILPEGTEPLCASIAEVNSYDVLCGRGGGTNSQVGNRRFRKLVQDFQPIYLLARRKEKPLMARTIVLIIRKRGGRFLKKDEETGEMFEVGDVKAEAKTSQALREGLDVRATKSAASSLLEKKKRQQKKSSNSVSDDVLSPMSVDHSIGSGNSPSPAARSGSRSPVQQHPQPQSPPTLPRLAVGDDELKSSSGLVHPHSPDQVEFRKRRRMRVDSATATTGAPSDRFFPEFCPPRATELNGRPPSPAWNNYSTNPGASSYFHHHDDHDAPPSSSSLTPLRQSPSHDQDDDIRYNVEEEEEDSSTLMPDIEPRGCAGAALEMVAGAAATGFACLGSANWRQ